MITLRTINLAIALTIAAAAFAPTGSQARVLGGGIKNVAPVVAPIARATGAQGVTGAALAAKKKRCKFVSTPYPHLECSF